MIFPLLFLKKKNLAFLMLSPPEIAVTFLYSIVTMRKEHLQIMDSKKFSIMAPSIHIFHKPFIFLS